MKGEVVYYRLFDIGAAIDLDEVQRRVAMPFLSGRIVSERAAPKYARLGQPILVHVDQREVETNLGRITVSIAVHLYGVCALSVVVRTPFDASSLRDLRPYGILRLRTADQEETLDAYCARIAERIEEDLVPYMHDSYDVPIDPEPYTVYCVTVSEHPVRTFANGWRREVTALLASDPRPDDISDEEVEDTWKSWLSYYQDDLVVVEWDAALLIEPTASYEDTLAVLEVANLQLLELRTYDAFLDRRSTRRTMTSRTSSGGRPCCAAGARRSRSSRNSAWTCPRPRSRWTTSPSSGATGSWGRCTAPARGSSSWSPGDTRSRPRCRT